MKMLEGVLVGAIVVVAILGVAWWMGWVHVALPGSTDMLEMEGMSADEHAGMDMSAQPTAADMNMSAEEHAGMDTGTPAAAAGSDMPDGAVMIPLERQQLIGVRTAPVVRRRLHHTVRTVGRVDYDETRVKHIHTKITGWIEKLHVDFTGEQVDEGQPLLDIYSPDLVATQEEYLLALRAQESLGESEFAEIASTTKSLFDATRRRLLLWDITEQQIKELEERREPVKTLTVYSPIRGFVIHKNAYEGQYIGPTDELYTIADLSEIWVSADIYEQDLPHVRVGQRATVTLSYMPGKTFRGRVDYVYPYLEGKTRTGKVRVVLSNPDLTLKPNMFANVELLTQLGESLIIPEDAVIDTGERQVVFLVLEGGHFLPREIQAGMRVDGEIQVLSGLQEGDVVVSGAAFLVDSESKLGSALSTMSGHQH